MTNKVAIVTDSVACIPKEQAEKYGIEVVPIQLIFGNRTYRDGVDISPAEFYTMLRKALCISVDMPVFVNSTY